MAFYVSAAIVVGGAVLGSALAPGAPDAPDYTATAAASRYAAELSRDSATAQLAESRRQYDESMAVSRPVAEAQLGLMRQQQQQGDEYYNYMLGSQRPLEQTMQAQAMNTGSAADQADFAARGIADTTTGYSRALGAAQRQGIRYGFSADKMASGMAANATNQAEAQARAANAGRSSRENLGWAQKADVAGLYRGLTGASAGAYSLSLNAGDSAVRNQMAPGQAMLANNAGAYGLMQQGAGQQLQGLSGIMNSQAGSYNIGLGQPGVDMGGLMQGSAALATAYNGRKA